jgi:hypothetical protein
MSPTANHFRSELKSFEDGPAPIILEAQYLGSTKIPLHGASIKMCLSNST